MNKRVEQQLNDSPTARLIAKIHPEGSTVSKQEIKDLYATLSKTEKRDKKGGRENAGKNKTRSPRQVKIRRGRSLFNLFVKNGFWIAE